MESFAGGIKGGFAYDVYNQLINKAYGSLDVHLTKEKRLTLGADVDFFVPTFDADSIWNWFTHNPVTTVLGRVAVRPTDNFDVSLSAGARLWIADGDPDEYATAQCTALADGNQTNLNNCLQLGLDPSAGRDEEFARAQENRDAQMAPDLLGNLGARYRWGTGEAGVRSMLQTGFGDAATNRGRRTGGRLTGKQLLASGGAGVMYLGASTSLYHWLDPLRDERDALSFGYTVAPEFRPWENLHARVEWEHNMNRLVGQRFRILGLVNLRVLP